MPRCNSLRLVSRSLIDFVICRLDFIKWTADRAALLEAVKRVDLIHFNHENLFVIAGWLRRLHDKPQTMHIRSLPYENWFARWHFRQIEQSVDHSIYISENEYNEVERLLGHQPRGSVIYNIVPEPDAVAPHESVPKDHRLKVATLSNFDLTRGTDRLLEIAERIARRGRRDILFVVAGDMTMRGALPPDLSSGDRNFSAQIKARGLADMFLFLGHVRVPERVLAACDVLIKPTRQDNPWGRDILEALSRGMPVISIGKYDRFVQSDVTGFLLDTYDADNVVDIILRLDSDRDLLTRLGKAGKQRISVLCNGKDRANDLLEVWRKAIFDRQRLDT